MSGVKKKKKRRRSTVAIPCLIVMLVCLTIFGLVALYYYNYLTNKDNTTVVSSTLKSYDAKESDNASVLFILDFDDDATKKTFVLLKTIVTEREFVVVPIPNNTRLKKGLSDVTVESLYTSGGADSLKKALSDKLGVPIEKYMNLNDEAFKKVIDSMGGVNYVVPDGLKDLMPGNQFLAAQQLKTFLTNTNYETEERRNQSVGVVIAKLIEETKGNRVGIVAEGVFNELINIIDTDVSKIEFTNQLKAITYMFENNEYTTYCRTPEGQSTIDGYFDISDEYLTSLKSWFRLNEEQ